VFVCVCNITIMIFGVALISRAGGSGDRSDCVVCVYMCLYSDSVVCVYVSI
jgi:hypothetical protein